MPDLRHSLSVRKLDRVLVAAALVLVAAVAVDALRGRSGGGEPPQAQREPPRATTATLERTAPSPAVRSQWSLSAAAAAPVPEEVRLVPSSTTFLPRCPTSSLSLEVGPGPQLVLRFAGPRCHVPPLHLEATVRDKDERVIYRGPALAGEELSGNFAGEAVRRARLVIGCRAERLVAAVSGSGLSASGPVRCRGGR